MKNVVLVIGILFGFLQAKSQWVKVTPFIDRSSGLYYLNASGNGTYQYIREVGGSGRYKLKSGTINADGSLGVEYTYSTTSTFCFSYIDKDTLLIVSQRPHYLGYPNLDTFQLAKFARGQVVINFSQPIYSNLGWYNCRKIAGEFVVPSRDTLYFYSSNSYSLTRKIKSNGGYTNYFYNNGILNGQSFRASTNNGNSFIYHGIYDTVSNRLINKPLDVFQIPADIGNIGNIRFYGGCSDEYNSINSSPDSITFYNFGSGQVTQKLNEKKYFFRKTIDPPKPMVVSPQRTFSMANSIDSIYYVDQDAYPYRRNNGQHRIYKFNRSNATYELIDSAYTDNTLIYRIHIKNGQVIFLDERGTMWIKQFPLSEPKLPQQPKIALYPNPATEYLGISGITTSGKYVIQDALGRICLQGESADQIGLAGLTPGLYWFTLQSESGRYSTKFVKR